MCVSSVPSNQQAKTGVPLSDQHKKMSFVDKFTHKDGDTKSEHLWTFEDLKTNIHNHPYLCEWFNATDQPFQTHKYKVFFDFDMKVDEEPTEAEVNAISAQLRADIRAQVGPADAYTIFEAWREPAVVNGKWKISYRFYLDGVVATLPKMKVRSEIGSLIWLITPPSCKHLLHARTGSSTLASTARMGR